MKVRAHTDIESRVNISRLFLNNRYLVLVESAFRPAKTRANENDFDNRFENVALIPIAFCLAKHYIGGSTSECIFESDEDQMRVHYKNCYGPHGSALQKAQGTIWECIP